MDIHKAFQNGAMQIAKNNAEYTNLHRGHGIDQHHWELITQDEYWSPDQARQIRSILAATCEIAMTISGMPAIPLPGQYVAACIAAVVSPCNRLLACTKAPETFDAAVAAGIMGTHEVKPMTSQQLMGLVLAYSGGFKGEPPAHKLPKTVKTEIVKGNQK